MLLNHFSIIWNCSQGLHYSTGSLPESVEGSEQEPKLKSLSVSKLAVLNELDLVLAVGNLFYLPSAALLNRSTSFFN